MPFVWAIFRAAQGKTFQFAKSPDYYRNLENQPQYASKLIKYS